MDQELGPFTITPTQIASLGAAFTPFVNALLRTEVAAAGLSGSLITTTYQENVGDEGVDAGLTRAIESRFVPAGESAWQFKRGDLQPAKCRAEIAGAAAALEILRNGGKYRLVLGGDINFAKVQSRRKALREEAARLGIELEDDSIEVLTASDLAEWAESRPALAVSHLVGGIRGAAEDFASWATSTGASTEWVASTVRQDIINRVRNLVETGGQATLHLEGVSGLGKTRTVLEALRGQPYQSLVVYVRDADAFPASLIRYLTGEGRNAILVVDDCDPKQHKNLAGAIPADSSLKLITIGEPGPSRVEEEHVQLPPIEDAAMAEILKLNRPSLWPEASQFVTDVSAGNVRLALFLAGAVEKQPRSSAAVLITKDIIEAYVTEALPAGTSFLACCALALVTRIGYDAEFTGEFELLSDVVGISGTELRASARTLAELGLLTSKGRFRSVAPQPLAVYLASRGWDEFGPRIIERLFPAMNTYLAERLLQRAAEIGPSDVVLDAVNAFLSRAELFGSFSAIATSGYSHALIQIAILAPTKVSAKLSGILAAATDAELQAEQAVRRNLIWTLEKLAWHSATFEEAADALLRLAVNENETFSNNAAGTWCSLFGTMLPSTAAQPNARLAYLRRVSMSDDPRVRALAARAAASMLAPHETVMVSAERQLGVVVEPRGRPATLGDVWEYQRAAIQLLRQLADDDDPAIAMVALDALISAIHPYLQHQLVRGDLFSSLKTLPEDGVRRVRTEITHIQGLFQRVTPEPEMVEGLEMLLAELPAPSPLEELRSLAHGRRWDLGEGELQRRITELARSISAAQGAEPLITLLASDLPAAFELGRSLAVVAPGHDTLTSLTPLATGENSPALVGYLWGLVDAGNPAAFDDYLDDSRFSLDAATRLGITVRGPQSEDGWSRVERLISELPVHQAANGLFGWHVGIEPSRLVMILASWIDRIESQRDYNAAVGFMGLALFQRPDSLDELENLVARLVQLRERFPETAQHQSWEWVQLAKRQIDKQPNDLLKCLVQLINSGALQIFVAGEERNLLKSAFNKSGVQGWELVTEMLQAGSWRFQIDVRGWLVEEFAADVVTDWIGSDVERAKAVASIASAGAEEPTPVARYLLEHFGDEDQVTGPLAGEFWSGFWTGNESDRLTGQIAQLQRWVESPEPEGVKRWAREMIHSLEQERERALRQEAEED